MRTLPVAITANSNHCVLPSGKAPCVACALPHWQNIITASDFLSFTHWWKERERRVIYGRLRHSLETLTSFPYNSGLIALHCIWWWQGRVPTAWSRGRKEGSSGVSGIVSNGHVPIGSRGKQVAFYLHNYLSSFFFPIITRNMLMSYMFCHSIINQTRNSKTKEF